MTEFLAVYNENDELLPEKLERTNRENIEKGKYFRIVIVFIENNKKEFLIQKVVPRKGDCFATTGGHVQYGISSLDTIVTEVEEELGIKVPKEEFQLLYTFKRFKVYQDVYYLKREIDINALNLQESELEYVEWMSVNKIMQLIEKGQFRNSNIDPIKKLLAENNND